MGKRWYTRIALRLTIVTLIASLISSSSLTAFAQEPAADPAPLPAQESDENTAQEVVSEYSQLMRTVDSLQKNEAEKIEKKDEVIGKLDELITVEQERLDRLGVSEEKQEKYFRILEKQKLQLQNPTPAPEEQPAPPAEEPGFFEQLFGDDEPTPLAPDEVQIPQEPATFEFAKDDIQIQQLEDTHIQPQAFQYVPQLLASLVAVDEAHAFVDDYLPTIEQVRPDDQEVVITPEMRNLVKSLNNNPVEIFNYLRTNIRYEPYYGAKKGSQGCFAERVCNDVDGSSLAVALYRAAGVPARYEKSAAVFTVEDLRNLLGVDETKTVYAALALNKVPVFTVTDGLVGENLDDADFSNETHLALEWTHVEVFYDYDQRGGNTDNSLTFGEAQDTAAVREILRPYPKKQWIPLDVIVQNYTRTQRPILVDQAHFDSEAFWYGFFQYQGGSTPLQKYTQDLQTATGQQLAANLTDKTASPDQVSILPVTLPYFIGAGDAGRIQIGREQFAQIPNWMKQKIAIQLKKDGNNEVLLSANLWGSEANNAKIDLSYEGATEVDKNVINDNGGIHQTPSALVDIVPYFRSGNGKIAGVNGDANNRPIVAIGDTLVLHFEYMIGDTVIYSDEKFSVGGNNEGIFLTLSQVAEDSVLDDFNDLERSNKILLDGDASLAREYLRIIHADAQVLKKSLDYDFNMHFARAVVTQNRILREIDGTPTTFEFKGLSLDASTYITDYSNRGNYKNHRKDFRLIWGQHASYMEAGLFENIAGLESFSTVNGMQYAYENPNDYTVHRINAQNENVIDGLALSNNTKQNLHAEVQAGNTVVTPDKAIQNGNWRGILYVSLDDDWTGQYAIGEQVANNGADTIEDMEILGYEDENGVERQYYQVALANGGNYYYDQNRVRAVSCRPDPALANIVANEWQRFYGKPCLRGEVWFGSNRHTYIQGTNGAKFYGDRGGVNLYSRSVSEQDTADNMSIYLEGHYPHNSINGYKFSFSTILGTYKNGFCAEDPGFGWNDCDDADDGVMYYSPYPSNGGPIFAVTGDMLGTLDRNDKEVVKRIGFPRADEQQAAPSPDGTTGTYQDFINGQLYSYRSYGIKWTYYTYGKITERHNLGGGTRSAEGFPDDDPIIRNGFSYQRFENGNEIEWNHSNGSTNVVPGRKYRCELYGDVTSDFKLKLYTLHGLADSGLQTLDGLADLAMIGVKSIAHPIDAAQSAYSTATDVYAQISNTNFAAVTQLLSSMGNRIVDEYNASFGPQGCKARQAYMKGKIVGEALLIIAPASKLKALAKVKILNRIELAFPGLKLITAEGKFRRILKIVADADVTEWNRVKSLPQVEKGAAGENFWKKFVNGNRQAFPVSEPGLGDRVVDVWDSKNGIAYEVKNYASSKVSADADIIGQVNKDVFLMNNEARFRPVWVFIDQGPTQPLANLLQESGIDIITLSN